MMLSLNNVTVYYNKLKALDNLSFTVEEKEIFGLLGPNGSGKTTTLKVVVGLIKPNSGNASIRNMDIWKNKDRMKKDVGYCPQFDSFNEKLTVKENIKYFAKLYGVEGNLNDIIENVCSYLGLTKKIDEWAENLSGGLKRRLNIACGIIHEPKLLILDEPTIGLDPISRNSIWKLIKAMKSEGATIILATNIMEEAEYLCNEIVLLKNGRSIIKGNLAEIRSRTPRIETIIIYTENALEINYQTIINYIQNLDGVLDVEYTNDVVRIKVNASRREEVMRYSVSQLRLSSVNVESVDVIPSSLIDAFEILEGGE
jgi:ABC-2 type transport system ATP-binding protein